MSTIARSRHPNADYNCRSSINRPRPRSANRQTGASSDALGYPARTSTMALPSAAAAISHPRPCPAINTLTSNLTARGSQIPIDRVRRKAVPLPARGFLP